MGDTSQDNAACAPGVKFSGGSCISVEILEDMINSYNSSHDDKIDISSMSHVGKYNPVTYKKKLVSILETKLKQHGCDDQTCWLTLPFFDKLNEPNHTKELHKYTFKPYGPKLTNKWLNTFDINDVFDQYEHFYTDFKFMGANPRDFAELPSTGIPTLDFGKMIESGKHKLGFVFNLDKHNQRGSHWVALFTDLLKGQIYYIDSVGEMPMREFKLLMKRIKDFCSSDFRIEYCKKHPEIQSCSDVSLKLDIRYNPNQHQHGDTECGVYSISFILRLLDGETFDEIINNGLSDNEIKQCRRLYFR